VPETGEIETVGEFNKLSRYQAKRQAAICAREGHRRHWEEEERRTWQEEKARRDARTVRTGKPIRLHHVIGVGYFDKDGRQWVAPNATEDDNRWYNMGTGEYRAPDMLEFDEEG
jgi:hypothetical protein